MSLWFRMYAGAYRNPKVAALCDRDYRVWVLLLSIAAENDGSIPELGTLKRLASMRLDHLLGSVQRLVKARLIDELGDGYEPHNWGEKQFKSDTSTPRVTLHRQRKETLHVTPPEPEPEPESETVCETREADFDRIVTEWNEMAQSANLPTVAKLNPNRRKRLRARLSEHGADKFTEAIAAVGRSSFCKGDSAGGWRANFDFLLQPDSFNRLIEGAYDRAKGSGNGQRGGTNGRAGNGDDHPGGRTGAAADRVFGPGW